MAKLYVGIDAMSSIAELNLSDEGIYTRLHYIVHTAIVSEGKHTADEERASKATIGGYVHVSVFVRVRLCPMWE